MSNELKRKRERIIDQLDKIANECKEFFPEICIILNTIVSCYYSGILDQHVGQSDKINQMLEFIINSNKKADLN